MERVYYTIDEKMAKLSHDMMSMRDYKVDSATQAYKMQVDEVYDLADEVVKVKPKATERAYALADRYAKRLADNINKENRIGTMCPSILIAGGSNFPVRKKEKQLEAWEANHKDYEKVQEIKDKLNSILYGQEVIKSSESDAVERLEEKLEKLEANQIKMKTVNAYYRKHKTLDRCPDLTVEEIESLKQEMSSDWHYEDKPYLSYQLSNNNQNIRSTKARLEKLKAIKGSETKEYDTEYFKVVENTDIMRLQIIFNDKPEPNVRDILKRNGFKWAPSQSAWQRHLNNNSKYALESVIEELGK